ncbi:MAG: ParB/RepB/Spo0J family partition protein [Oscillospiraceae bacterium]|nr:ParB/RepB/Spo0J family partition protein [Oscillospiraceae bacterium]
MAAKKGGLGTGLDALFLDNSNDEALSGEATNELKLSEVEPDRGQPRQVFDDDALAELAESIRNHGVLQPILVRPLANGRYQIVAGERRWRASRLAGKDTIPAIVRNLSDLEAMTIALVENLQREDLNPVDEALGYKKLMEVSGLTQEQAAKQVGRSRPAVANALRLLSLPEDVLGMLREGALTTGHAKAILSIADPALRSAVAKQVSESGMTVRDAEKLCAKPAKQQKLPLPKAKDSVAQEVELSLQNALGVEVRCKYKDGRGTLCVDFYSKDQLFDFANRLGK